MNNVKRKCYIDMPGEFINAKKGLSEDFLYKYEGAFSAAHALWFCTDLVQLSSSKDIDFLDYMGYGETGVETIRGETSKILLEKVVGIVKLNRNLQVIKNRYFEHSDFPATAIIFTKNDGAEKSNLWSGIDIPEHILIEGDSGRDFKGENSVFTSKGHTLLLDEFCNLSKKVRNTLAKIDQTKNDRDEETICSTYIKSLENHFKKCAYFSVSAYSRKASRKPANSDADEESPEGRPQPYRTRLPLYWTLAVLGKLDVSVTTYREEKSGILSKKITEIKNHVVRSGDTYYDEDGKTEISVIDKLYRPDGK